MLKPRIKLTGELSPGGLRRLNLFKDVSVKLTNSKKSFGALTKVNSKIS